MRAIYSDYFVRISKQTARRCFADGENVYILACKLNPEGPWTRPALMQRTTETGEERAFDDIVNAYSYYNCGYAAGDYPAFYVEQ